MTRARNGVDINLAGKILEPINRFPGQREVSNFGRVLGEDIRGILEHRAGVDTFHRNPAFVPFESRVVTSVSPAADFSPLILVAVELVLPKNDSSYE